jgi:hypothetical protein
VQGTLLPTEEQSRGLTSPFSHFIVSSAKRYTSLLMTKVESLEREVEQLAPEELAAFRAWFIERDWHAWDRELERDVAAGRLDHLADEALAEYERGETTEL